jgi:hypothetical protein
MQLQPLLLAVIKTSNVRHNKRFDMMAFLRVVGDRPSLGRASLCVSLNSLDTWRRTHPAATCGGTASARTDFPPTWSGQIGSVSAGRTATIQKFGKPAAV